MNDRRRGKHDDRGIALISVLICVMLCFLLSATILRVSLLSYLQKGIARQSTTTFYENETYVDDIKLGVQNAVAKAFAATTSGSTDYVAKLQSELLNTTGATQRDKLAAKLASYIGSDDVEITVEGDSAGRAFVIENNEMVIKNVIIEYTVDEPGSQKDGYYSKIKTDIRIRSPYYIVESTSSFSLASYTLFAGGGVSITGGGSGNVSRLSQHGDVYVGYENGSYNATAKTAKAIDLTDYCTTILDGDSVTINGDVNVSYGSNLVILAKKVEIRGTLRLSNDSHLIVGSTCTEFKCKDIIMGCSQTQTTEQYWDTSNPYWPHWENRTVITLTGSNSVKGGYKKTGTKNNNALPKAGKNPDPNYIGEAAIYKWNGSNATECSVDGGAVSGLGVIKFNADDPVKNVTKTIDGQSYEFDKKYTEIIDVDYFVKFAKGNNMGGGVKSPQKRMLWSSGTWQNTDSPSEPQPVGFTKSGNKWIPSNANAMNNASIANDRMTYQYDDTHSTQVIVNVGTNYEVANSALYHFIIAFGPLNVTDMNNGRSVNGIYISNEKVTFAAKEGDSQAYPLTSLAADKAHAKKFFNELGAHVMSYDSVKDNAGSLGKYEVINNFFVDGIKIFYDGGSGGSVATLTYTNDIVRNNSLNVVTFENWEKQ